MLTASDEAAAVAEVVVDAFADVDVAALEADWGRGYARRPYVALAEAGMLELISRRTEDDPDGSIAVTMAQRLGAVPAVTPVFASAVLGAGTAGSAFGWEHPVVRSILDDAEVWPYAAYPDARSGFLARVPVARLSTDGRLDGAAVNVEYATEANGYVVPCERAGGFALALVRSDQGGVSATPQAVNGGSPHGQVVFDGVHVDPGAIAQADVVADAVRAATERVMVMQAAYLAGISRRTLDLTVEHVKTRHQFGAPLATRQAVQHHLAECLRRVEASELMAAQSAALLGSAPLALHAETKAWVAESTAFVVRYGHQLHGGVGAVHGHPMPLLSARAYAERVMYGAPAELWRTARELRGRVEGLL
jgi:alkylation response protein AidB-like acyl-CoA dehydrogenase